MYRVIGDYPKIHNIVKLLRELARLYNNCGSKDFIHDNLESLYLLEESYISSRYIPRKYDEEIASKMLMLAEKILEVFKCLEEKT